MAADDDTRNREDEVNAQMILRLVRAGFATLGVVAPGLAARVAIRLFFRPRRHRRPARERELLATAAELTLPGGLRGHAWGGGDRVVLLVHGWEGRGTQLGAFVAPLVARGFRVVGIDGPAHGDSPGGETNMVEYARAIHAVQTALGPLEGVVAHSFGVAATAFALDRGMRARRVVLVAGPASVGDVIRRFEELVALPPRVAARFRQRLVARVGHTAEEIEIASIGPRLQVPALVFHDPADAEVPFADALVIEDRWPGARLRVVEGHGHRRILRAEEVVREAAAFLAGDENDAGAARVA